MATSLILRTFFPNPTRIAGAIALAVVLSTTSLAQSSNLSEDENLIYFYEREGQYYDYEAENNGESGWGWARIRVGSVWQDEGDLNKTTGDLSVSRSFFEGWTGIESVENAESQRNVAFSVHLREEVSNYDFDGAGSLGLMKPFRRIESSSLSFSFSSWDDDGSWTLRSAYIFSDEQGVSTSFGLHRQANLNKLWRAGKSVELGIGLYAYTRLDNSIELLPVPVFNWQIAAGVRLGLVDSLNPGYGLQIQLSNNWQAYLIGNYEVRQSHLGDRVGLFDAGFVDEEINARLGLLWEFNSMNFELFGGLSRHKLSIETDDTLVSRDVADPAPVLGVSFSFGL